MGMGMSGMSGMGGMGGMGGPSIQGVKIGNNLGAGEIRKLVNKGLTLSQIQNKAGNKGINISSAGTNLLNVPSNLPGGDNDAGPGGDDDAGSGDGDGVYEYDDYYFTDPEYAAGMQAAELQTRSQISNYGWDSQKSMENIRQAAETERLKYEVDNKIPQIQAESKGRLDLQAIVNAGYKNIANIERGTEMVRNVTSMFNF